MRVYRWGINQRFLKSISRFARNTAECLEAIRKLIRLNVFILFEKENINVNL